MVVLWVSFPPYHTSLSLTSISCAHRAWIQSSPSLLLQITSYLLHPPEPCHILHPSHTEREGFNKPCTGNTPAEDREVCVSRCVSWANKWFDAYSSLIDLEFNQNQTNIFRMSIVKQSDSQNWSVFWISEYAHLPGLYDSKQHASTHARTSLPYMPLLLATLMCVPNSSRATEENGFYSLSDKQGY